MDSRTSLPLAALGLALAGALFASPAQAQGNTYVERPRLVTPDASDLGFGFQVGAPSAFVAKAMVSDQVGLDVGVGGLAPWVIGPTFSLHSDVLWHPFSIYENEQLTLTPYAGVGLQASFAPLEVVPNPFLNDGDLPSGLTDGDFDRHPLFGAVYYPYNSFGLSGGARAPFGLSLAFHNVPLELYGEAVPSLLMFPAVGGGLGFTGGLRLWI